MQISVNASKTYDVVIKPDLADFNKFQHCITGHKVAIITDSNVNKIYGDVLKQRIFEKQVFTFVIKAGEKSKNASNYIKILNFLAKNNFSRNDTIIAFGGGVVGDLAGFVSATYMRGINLIMVPTSLLSMVDSSVGGKTAIDLDSGKNLAGAFYQPSLVYIATDFLLTLNEREILSGMGEIVKYAFISKSVSFSLIEKGVSDQLIYECIKVKRDIVQNDERESGQRKLLNLGHTVGHAIEKFKKYKLSHGECVLNGLLYTINISNKLGVLSNENKKLAIQILNLVTFNAQQNLPKDNLIDIIKKDKKGKGDSVDLVVIDDRLLASVMTLKFSELYNLL